LQIAFLAISQGATKPVGSWPMVSGSLHWGFSLMMSSMGVSHAKSFQEVASKPL